MGSAVGSVMDAKDSVLEGSLEVPSSSRGTVQAWTDKYFSRTRAVIERFGDVEVTYAVFLRRPVLAATRIAREWLQSVVPADGPGIQVEEPFAEGDRVGAGEPVLFMTGRFSVLVELETRLLQKLGAACVAAWQAEAMCSELPQVDFMAMDARHCAGTEMADLMAYAASVGSFAARSRAGARGFVGNATDATAHWFGRREGMGTMPHALVGYAGSTVQAARMYHETFPDDPLTVLVDYFGCELDDSLEVCRAFPELASAGRLAVRLDTHGGRFLQGLDPQSSYAVLDQHAPQAIRGYRTDRELKYLIGTGVSAAAIWHMRDCLDRAGFSSVRIVASSGFTPEKCRVMGYAKAPVDVIGTGSFLPESWQETYATADIIAYGGEPRVKVGREFLLRRSGD